MKPWIPFGLKSSNENQINIPKAQEFLVRAYELLCNTAGDKNYLFIDLALSSLRAGRNDIAIKIKSQIDSTFLEKYNNAFFQGVISVQDSLEVLKNSNKINAFLAEKLCTKLAFDGHYSEAIDLASNYNIDFLYYKIVNIAKDNNDSVLNILSYFNNELTDKHFDLIFSYLNSKETIDFDQVEILLNNFPSINRNYYYDLCDRAFQQRRFDLYDKYLGLSKIDDYHLIQLFKIYGTLDLDKRTVLSKVINKYSFISSRKYYIWLSELYNQKKSYELILKECQQFKSKYQFSEFIIRYFISENQIDNAINFYNNSKHDKTNPNHVILVNLIEIGDFKRCYDFFKSLKIKERKFESIENIIAKLCELNLYDLAFQWLEILKTEGSKKAIYYPSILAMCQNQLASTSLLKHNYEIVENIIDSLESDIDKAWFLNSSAKFLLGCRWATAEYINPL